MNYSLLGLCNLQLENFSFYLIIAAKVKLTDRIRILKICFVLKRIVIPHDIGYIKIIKSFQRQNWDKKLF